MVAAFVACYWRFGAVAGASSPDGQDRPWAGASVHPYFQVGEKEGAASVYSSIKKGWIATEDYLDMSDEEEGDRRQSVDSRRTYEEMIGGGGVVLVGESQKELLKRGRFRHSPGMSSGGGRLEKDKHERKVKDEVCEGIGRGKESDADKKNQSSGGDMKGPGDEWKEVRVEAEVRRFFADPPWLRYSRLGAGSWMCSAYRKMSDKERKDEEEKVTMKSESWHKG